jgi:hypothetical protein
VMILELKVWHRFLVDAHCAPLSWRPEGPML